MKLFIHNQYQSAVEIEIGATAKVIELKELISTKINGILPIDQVLKYGIKTLSDSCTLQSYGLESNFVVKLTMKNTFEIYIKTKNNHIHELIVHHMNTVELVKKMLNRLLKIAVDQQLLLFNGKELQNEDILTEKFIKPGSTLNLIVSPLKLQLNIVERSGHVERIELSKNSTVAQLKQAILAKYNVPADYQTLKYNGKELDSKNTLADYNIEDFSEIFYRPKDHEIFIQFASIGRKPLALRVLPIDTIAQVKDKIQAETKINKNVQQLIWGGKVLVDDAIVSCEHIQSGSTLSLVMNVQNLKLNIELGPHYKIPIEAQSTETVAQLKAKLLDATKIPIDQQILFVDNIKLDDRKMLVDYGLNDESDIAMERIDSFEILIEAFQGRQITIRVHKSDTVSTIRQQIDQRLGVKPSHQRLLYFGQELANDTLEAYRIEKRCTIHLVSRVKGGN